MRGAFDLDLFEFSTVLLPQRLEVQAKGHISYSVEELAYALL
jgi:hypothetical protein